MVFQFKQADLKLAAQSMRRDLMKHARLISVFALVLTACGNSSDVSSVESPTESSTAETQMDVVSLDQPSNIPSSMDADGKVLITVERLVPESAACLVMMSVVNGTDETVNAGLFAFNVTGNGETAGANMFPQTAEAGVIKTAQIVLPGADCKNAKQIDGGQLNCRLVDSGESCMNVTELRDGIVDFTAND